MQDIVDTCTLLQGKEQGTKTAQALDRMADVYRDHQDASDQIANLVYAFGLSLRGNSRLKDVDTRDAAIIFENFKNTTFGLAYLGSGAAVKNAVEANIQKMLDIYNKGSTPVRESKFTNFFYNALGSKILPAFEQRLSLNRPAQSTIDFWNARRDRLLQEAVTPEEIQAINTEDPDHIGHFILAYQHLRTEITQQGNIQTLPDGSEILCDFLPSRFLSCFLTAEGGKFDYHTTIDDVILPVCPILRQYY